jgi:hypothetical protein
VPRPKYPLSLLESANVESVVSYFAADGDVPRTLNWKRIAELTRQRFRKCLKLFRMLSMIFFQLADIGQLPADCWQVLQLLRRECITLIA